LLLALARFVDGRKRDVIAKAGNVTIQKRRFSRSIGAANDDQAIGLLRCAGEMVHQDGILLGMKNFGRFREAGKRRPR
jgi:hypothetical protein